MTQCFLDTQGYNLQVIPTLSDWTLLSSVIDSPVSEIIIWMKFSFLCFNAFLFIYFFWGKSALSCLLPILLFFFLLRKTGRELTSMLIFLYFICGTPTTAWPAKLCHVRTRDPTHESWAPEAECANLTAATRDRLLHSLKESVNSYFPKQNKLTTYLPEARHMW